MVEVRDQTGALVRLEQPAKRIISLVPSITHLLYSFGLDQEVVAITKFCVHPKEWLEHKPRIGGTKDPKLKVILALKPDLIIANKEENRKEDVDLLSSEVPVYVSDVSSPEDALGLMEDLGVLLGKQSKANELQDAVRLHRQKRADRPSAQKTVLYFIWKKPWMIAGTDTYIHSLLQECGLINLAPSTRYPVVSDAEITQLNPELVLLSSEPYPFASKHLTELQALLPNAQIELVNGELFSWYGPFLEEFYIQREALMRSWSVLN